MTGEAGSGEVVGKQPSRAVIGRQPVRRGFGFAVMALWGLLWASTAWADSLVVMSGAGQSGLIGQASAHPIVVEARNVDGAVIAGRTIQWTTSNGFTLSAASSVTDANGLASVGFTYGNYGTTSTVAQDATSGVTAQAAETSLGSDSITLISGGGQKGLSGASASQPIVVELRDAAGKPIVGRTVNWTDLTQYTRVSAASSVTNASGRASVGFSYIANVQITSVQDINGFPALIRAVNAVGGQSLDVAETALGFDGLKSVSPASFSGRLGTTSPPLVVRLLHTDGTPVAGATVTWADRVEPAQGLTGTLVTPSSTSTVTDANGLTSITVQFVGSGSGDVEASYGLSNQSFPYTSVRGGSLTVMSVIGSSGPPGSPSPTPIVVESHNNDGSLSVGATINWTAGGGDAVPSAASSVTDASGRASVGFVFGTVDSTIRATDTISGRFVGIPINATAQDTIRVVSGQGQVGTVGTPAAQPIVVEVLTSAGAPVVGVGVFWSSSGLDPSSGGVDLAAPSSVTDASGRTSMSFNYRFFGRTTISAQESGLRIVSVRVAAEGMETVTVISGDRQSGLIGSHGAQPLVAELRDAAGRPVVGVTLTWAGGFGPSPGCALDSPTSVTDASGRVSMGFTYGSSPGVCPWEVGGYTTRARADFNVFMAGADAISLISGNGQTGPENSAGAQPLVAEVRDAVGALVVGRTINWSTSSGNATASAPSSITDAAGRTSVGFNFGNYNGSSSSLTATDPANGHQLNFSVTATRNQGSALIVSGNGQSGLPGSAGALPIVIELRDGANAPAPGRAVTWSVLSGPATLLTTTTTTDASGQASSTFNFGPTAGTSVIQARDTASGQLLQATVTALGSHQDLIVVSGDGQLLVANVASAPLVVQLKDANSVPVVAETITWIASNGTLAAATSVTDANGKASNTVTSTSTGVVTVQASSARASSGVTFTLNSNLATLPGLTPAEAATAVALDSACTALSHQATLSPQEADLLAQCQHLVASAAVDTNATTNALAQLVADSAQAQSSAATSAAIAQFQNINTRLTALRSGSSTLSLSGLGFAGSGGVIPLTSLLAALFDETTPQAGAGDGFSKWGFFATGTIGRGEAKAGSATPAYDYDINGLTAGVDYRQRDNWIFGAAVGYSRQDTNLADDQGDVSMDGWSVSSYSTYSFHGNLYLDGVITLGRNSFDLHRHITYTLLLPDGSLSHIDQLATGHPDGDQSSAALTFGGDFHKSAWNVSPYGQVIYSRLKFGSYQESLHAGPGNGLGLAVDSRTVTGLASVFGARVSYSHSTDWGVLVPSASIEWNHEFKDNPDAITAYFIYDPTQTPIQITGDAIDTDYFHAGLGLSLVLMHGRSGFLLWEHTLDRSGFSQDNYSLGIRIEF